MAKLKKLLEDISMGLDDTPKVNKFEVIEGVSQYGNIGKYLYNETNIIEIASKLVEIAESAHSHVMSESDDWFDKVSVSRNMKGLQNMVKEFKKTAQESHQLNQRLTGLYEDMGHVLNRYYDIHEDVEDRMDEDLTSSNIGKSDNELSSDAAKSSPEYNKDEKYKYNESVDGDNDEDIEDYLKKPNKQVNKKTNPFKMVPTESKKVEDAIKETAMNKKPTKRLKDISLVNLSPVGLFKKSGK
tara:strand:+ start:71 stop:796 length:726 start_codon:yes stop_codon:yes gene_type:complete